MRFFTENDKEVTDRVKDGRTKVFTDANSAEKYARQKKIISLSIIRNG